MWACVFPLDLRRAASGLAAPALVGQVVAVHPQFSSNAPGNKLRELAREIVRCVIPPLRICVDHEVGRVQRFSAGDFRRYRPCRGWCSLWDRDGIGGLQQRRFSIGTVIGSELLQSTALNPDVCVPGTRSGRGGPQAPVYRRSGPLHVRRPPLAVDCPGGQPDARALAAGAGMAARQHFPGHGWPKPTSHQRSAAWTPTVRCRRSVEHEPRFRYRWLWRSRARDAGPRRVA